MKRPTENQPITDAERAANNPYFDTTAGPVFTPEQWALIKKRTFIAVAVVGAIVVGVVKRCGS
ncbi:MAG: hypothetical protein ACRYGA_02145 [Janthinobacterium lividum]